ncbi:hypothetical protein [Bacillus sp. 179-C3.3 HS]|uniref:hypothetical protein n=1 Tax=Bacillus sp. 179-C3.3 HS TaxID=3232162 RepID=UPI0039A2AF52
MKRSSRFEIGIISSPHIQRRFLDGTAKDLSIDSKEAQIDIYIAIDDKIIA